VVAVQNLAFFQNKFSLLDIGLPNHPGEGERVYIALDATKLVPSEGTPTRT